MEDAESRQPNSLLVPSLGVIEKRASKKTQPSYGSNFEPPQFGYKATIPIPTKKGCCQRAFRWVLPQIVGKWCVGGIALL